MAGSVILTSLSQLQEQRKGFQALSITNFDTVDTTAPEIALGSRIEIAGSVVQFTADESILGFAGLGVGIAYAYIDGSALTANWTATAPTWDAEKQGYYDVTGANRYFMRCEKDAGGNYLHKALYTNIRGVMRTYKGLALNTLIDADQEIRLASDASFKWNEAADQWELDKPLSITGKVIESNAGYLHGVNITHNTVFDALAPVIPNTNDWRMVSGTAMAAEAPIWINRAVRTNATTITLYGFTFDQDVNAFITNQNLATITVNDGVGTALTLYLSITW